jgi:hypothetical protein
MALNDNLAPSSFSEVWKALRHLWIAPGMLHASSQYGKMFKTVVKNEFIETANNQVSVYLEKLGKQFPWLQTEKHIKEIEYLRSHIRDKMPDSLPLLVQEKREETPNDVLFILQENADMAVEIEIEQQAQQELEVSLQTHAEEESDLNLEDARRAHFIDFKDITELDDNSIRSYYYFKLPRFPLSLYLFKQPEFQPLADAFKDILITLDVFSWPSGECSVKALRLFGKYRTPIHYLQIENEDTVTIMNQQRASDWFANTMKPIWDSSLNKLVIKDEPIPLYSLSHKFLDLRMAPKSIAKQKSLMAKVVKVKFLNGETHYNKEEQIALKQWLQESGPTLMRQFFINHVLMNRPDIVAAFPGSILARIFKELIAEENLKKGAIKIRIL